MPRTANHTPPKPKPKPKRKPKRKLDDTDTIVTQRIGNLTFHSHLRNNELHRDNDQPAMIGVLHKHRSLDEIKLIEHALYLAWFSDGEHHRDHGLPAEVWIDSFVREAYWLNNQRHRDLPLPAVQYGNGTGDLFVHGVYHGSIHTDDRKTLTWYLNRAQHAAEDRLVWSNTVHRDAEDGPAITTYSDHLFGTVIEERYITFGGFHRPHDLPAIINHTQTRSEYYIEGMRHRSHGRPAVVDEYQKRYEYWKMGRRSREHGPAIDHGREWAWYLHGMPHRTDGPWSSDHPNEWRTHGLLSRCGNEPAVDTEAATEYRVLGKLFRTDGGPAQVVRSGGVEVSSWFMARGKRYRPVEHDDQPAEIICRDGIVISESWFHVPNVQWRAHDRPSHISYRTLTKRSKWTGTRGHLSRVTGPAVVVEDAAGKVVLEQYWLNGRRLSQDMHGRLVRWIVRARNRYKEEEFASVAGSRLLRVKACLFNCLV